MWVDTKGEDGPQCIHHTPVGALMAQPPPSKSCRSLQYALQNRMNRTSIKIKCGTHKLQSFKFVIAKGRSFALKIEGECATNRPIVMCWHGTAVSFSSFIELQIGRIVFEGCGLQELPKVIDYIPTLYFTNCTNVTLQLVTVHITEQYGTGIVLMNAVTHGVFTLYDVSVLHNGTHGGGSHYHIHGQKQSPVQNFSLYMNNVQMINTNTHTEYDPLMLFKGIDIFLSGTGSGNRISLYNVTVFNSAPVTGIGIRVGLFDNMRNNTVTLASINVMDGWDEHYSSKNETEVLAECTRRQLGMIASENKLSVYNSVQLQVQTSYNTINVTDSHVVASYGPVNVYALAVTFKALAALNRVHLENTSISARGNSNITLYGFTMVFGDNSTKNLAYIQNLQIVNGTTVKVSGVGALFDFQCSCTRNNVFLERSIIANQQAAGGGLIAGFRGYASHNAITLHFVRLENNTALRGGGIQMILSDSSSKNRILQEVY